MEVEKSFTFQSCVLINVCTYVAYGCVIRVDGQRQFVESNSKKIYRLWDKVFKLCRIFPQQRAQNTFQSIDSTKITIYQRLDRVQMCQDRCIEMNWPLLPDTQTSSNSDIYIYFFI